MTRASEQLNPVQPAVSKQLKIQRRVLQPSHHFSIKGDDGAVTGSAVLRRICLINPADLQLLVRCEMSYGKHEGRSIADFPGVRANGAYSTGGACGELVSATCRAELKLGVTLTNQPP